MNNDLMYNPVQAQTLEKYPGYLDFMKVMHPANLPLLYADIKTVTDSVSAERLSIHDLFVIYPDKQSRSVEYMKAWLEYFQNLLNISRRLTMPADVALILCSHFSDLYFSDLKLIAEFILAGKYGTFYGSVDSQRIVSSFSEYYTARAEAIGVVNDSRLAKLTAREEDQLKQSLRKKHAEDMKNEIYKQILAEGIPKEESIPLLELRYKERFDALYADESKKLIDEKLKKQNKQQ